MIDRQFFEEKSKDALIDLCLGYSIEIDNLRFQLREVNLHIQELENEIEDLHNDIEEILR